MIREETTHERHLDLKERREMPINPLFVDGPLRERNIPLPYLMRYYEHTMADYEHGYESFLYTIIKFGIQSGGTVFTMWYEYCGEEPPKAEDLAELIFSDRAKAARFEQ